MRVLVTGAGRGLGLGFVQHYLRAGATVWAAHRGDPGGLAALERKRLHLLRWDVSRDDGPKGVLPPAIDLLINNAGIYGPPKAQQALATVTPQAMLDVFNVDCVGPLRVVQALHARLAPGGVVANISSKMGSSTDNRSGGTYAYRAAKAALLVVSRSMAVDLAAREVHVLSLHPGWVATDMTGGRGLIDVQTSVAGMADVLRRAREYESGAFVAFDGSLVPY
ncbi:MAG: SDR family oxidoreductase [Zetaproteobacteria bacterium]|nr:MAG: SDR family oxidoreductase [Zetaproteobacteria bacterium]